MPVFELCRDLAKKAPSNPGPAPAGARLLSALTLLTACVLSALPGRVPAAERELGAYLAGECTACHHLDGAREGVPAISGLTERDFIAAMREYRSGAREAAVMRSVAAALDDREIEALARYFTAGEVQ